MPRNIKPPTTLKERYGSCQNMLDSTEQDHNGFGYDDFRWRINPQRKHKPSVASAAEDFAVSPKTFYGWVKWDEEDRSTEADPVTPVELPASETPSVPPVSA